MEDTASALVTPAKSQIQHTNVVDIATIEQQKENIQPLASGRSASQLASLSSHTRSGLGSKLADEHKLFQARVDAVEAFERGGQWSAREARDGDGFNFTAEEVSTWAEDPLDLHHQYARFVVGHYPAGASATSKLVPLLEASTRKFVDDERYKNDPRYLRLWNLYAKHMEQPVDCYRFLFAKGIGEKLASLYEEFALVLEQAGRRSEADKVYTLGINRFAMPLDRIKRRHKDFQERMLHAPPVSSPPRSAPSSSATPSMSAARPILSGAGMAPSGAGVGGKENGGSAFAVFRDTAASVSHADGAQWDDLGTVKSRKRENEVEAKEWKGETLPMSGGTAASATKPAPFKLEVFRDASAAPPTPSSHAESAGDVFTRSLRGPSEAEALRQNPFKNFSSTDRQLAAVDPLEGLSVVSAESQSAPKVKAAKSTSSATGSKKSSKSKEDKAVKKPSEKPTSERVACDLAAIYPAPGVEFSIEELMMKKRAQRVDAWSTWTWRTQWEEETRRTGRTTYTFDPVTSLPLLHDRDTQAPLYDFVPRPEPAPRSPSPPPDEAGETTFLDSPSRSSTSQPAHSLLSPSPVRTVRESAAHLVEPLSPSPTASPLKPRRAPSPTINTRLAADLVDNLFAKTLDFGRENGDGRASDSEDERDDSDEDDDDEEEERADWADIPHSQLDQASQSQSQATGLPSTQDDDYDVPYVPFSQTQTQEHSQFEHESLDRLAPFNELSDVQEQSEPSSNNSADRSNDTPTQRPEPAPPAQHDENGQIEATGPPMQLFRDSGPVPPSTPGFRPSRPPLGAKPLVGARAPPPAPSSLFTILSDRVPSSQEEEEDEEQENDNEQSFEDFEAPLNEHDDEENVMHGQRGMGDGFAMGRREKGVPSRYAPFIDAMTPVKEATMEYTTSSLSTSQRTRRDSVFSARAAPVEEEDEDDESDEEEEEDADRAFVAYQPEEESDRSSFRTRAGSSSDEDEPDTEDDEPAPLPVAAVEAVSLDDSANDRRDSTRKDGQFDESTVERSSSVAAGQERDRSFDASLNTSLPEGFTITGNQSGMTTGMVLADTTNIPTNMSTGDASQSGDVPVNPFTVAVTASLLAIASPPVLQHPDVRDLTTLTAGNLPSLQKTAKRRMSKAGKDRTGVIDDAWEIQLGDELYSVREKLGEGAFGAVFRIAAQSNPDESFDADAEDEEASIAVKIEEPANLWEFHILDRLHSRLDERTRQAVIKASRLYAYRDESYLLLDFCDQGSLLDAVNKANESGVAPPTGGVSAGLDEVVAMFFVVELLRVIEGFHSAGFIHGDLKIDNCLVRLDEVAGGARNWSTAYDPTGAGGWSRKGVRVIDFGRTIDTSLFPPGQRFLSNFKTDDFDCFEMRRGESWTFEPDYFGLASIAFNLLFGRYMETKEVQDATRASGTRQAINQNFRRYHQADLWGRLFDMLLNPKTVREDASLPITNELAAVRQDMEEWLRTNSDKGGKSLKSLIRKLEIYAMSK